MKANWIDTQTIYREIIAAPDRATREQIYLERLVQPWQTMMTMIGGNSDDPFAGARRWHWFLPEQLMSAPVVLQKLESAEAWQTGSKAMTRATTVFAPYTDQIPIDTIEGWLTLADPERADPIGRGYTGGVDFTAPRFVVQYDDPNEYNLPRLAGCIVHEMHHLIRTAVCPWNFMQATVGDYIVHEGLAESFAAALYGEEVLGYYVTEFDEAQLDTAKTLIADNLQTTGFDKLRAFIFGDYWSHKLGLPAVGMPDYGGYAIGYRVVQAYLERTGKSVQEATFVSSAEIIANSHYF